MRGVQFGFAARDEANASAFLGETDSQAFTDSAAASGNEDVRILKEQRSYYRAMIISYRAVARRSKSSADSLGSDSITITAADTSAFNSMASITTGYGPETHCAT